MPYISKFVNIFSKYIFQLIFVTLDLAIFKTTLQTYSHLYPSRTDEM